MHLSDYPKKKKRQPKIKRDQLGISWAALIFTICMGLLIVLALWLLATRVIYAVKPPKMIHNNDPRWGLAFDYPANWRVIVHPGDEGGVYLAIKETDGAGYMTIIRGKVQTLFEKNHSIHSTDPAEAVRLHSNTQYLSVEETDDFAWPAWVGRGQYGTRLYLLEVTDEWVLCWGSDLNYLHQEELDGDYNLVDDVCQSLVVQP